MGSTAWNWLTAGIIFGAFALSAALLQALWLRLLRPAMRRWTPGISEEVFLPVRGLATSGLLLMGLYHGLRSLDVVAQSPRFTDLLGRGLAVGWVILAVMTALRVLHVAARWKIARSAGGSSAAGVDAGTTIATKTLSILVIAVGLLYALRVAGVDISPLLASGAIGGLAVALALQDTLSNLFAGYSLAIDRPVRPGDYIKLETGDEGFVEEIGWRNTRVRMWANNTVVVPNAKLSQSILTNYNLPQPSTSVYVWCSVAYDSDLQHVEDTAVSVARHIQRTVDGAQPDWEPVVRWKRFDDSGVTFVTALRAAEIGAQYALHSQFMKALHASFRREQIEIPFPVRRLIVDQDRAPDDAFGELNGSRRGRSEGARDA